MADYSYMTRVGLFLAVALCAAVLVNGAPQLFDSDNREPIVVSDAVDVEPSYRRVPRGSASSYSEPIAYGGDQISRGTHNHGHGHGHGFGGHGHGHGQGGHGHGWGGPVGPVFTYVRTDYHGNFQWGVRHKAGGGHGGHHGK